MLPTKKQVHGGESGKIEELRQLFVQELLSWNERHNRREMPWKGEKDPYKIWLSEIILQQTRVEQGRKYYDKFINAFPHIHALAEAPEENVMKLWEGLGYYSRCRNLILTARFISRDLGGLFPKTYDSLLELKGIGSYTAAAVSSFAYNLPHAVVDGNVFRVLSRVMGIEIPVDSTKGKKIFQELAQRLLPENQAAIYNQAIMDFGAQVCKPVPDCSNCFFSQTCVAYNSGKQGLLPVKDKKLQFRQRWFHYFIIRWKTELVIHQRLTGDIWAQLYEFPLIESGGPATVNEMIENLCKQFGIQETTAYLHYEGRQRLSHQILNIKIYEVRLESRTPMPGMRWVDRSELDQYAFPKTLADYIRQLRHG